MFMLAHFTHLSDKQSLDAMVYMQAAAPSQAESTAPASFPAAPLSELEISEQILKVARSPTISSDACPSVHHSQYPLLMLP